MAEIERHSADEVREKISTGGALLVCAYAEDEKFHKVHLDGAISLNDFSSRTHLISKDQEIYFYCA